MSTRMRSAAVMSLATLLIHDADHLRQAAIADYRIEVHVAILILAGFVPLVGGAVLVRLGRTRQAATLVAWGSGLVLLLLCFVHLVGVRAISDSLQPVAGLWGDTYWTLDVDWATWVALIVLASGQSWAFIESLRVRRQLIP